MRELLMTTRAKTADTVENSPQVSSRSPCFRSWKLLEMRIHIRTIYKGGGGTSIRYFRSPCVKTERWKVSFNKNNRCQAVRCFNRQTDLICELSVKSHFWSLNQLEHGLRLIFFILYDCKKDDTTVPRKNKVHSI